MTMGRGALLCKKMKVKLPSTMPICYQLSYPGLDKMKVTLQFLSGRVMGVVVISPNLRVVIYYLPLNCLPFLLVCDHQFLVVAFVFRIDDNHILRLEL